MSELTYAERVANGAKLLDGIDPIWYYAVDVEELDISNSYLCILGQLSGSWSDGVDFLIHHTGDPWWNSEQADHGFNLHKEELDQDGSDAANEALTEAWTELITKRIKADNKAWKQEIGVATVSLDKL